MDKELLLNGHLSLLFNSLLYSCNNLLEFSEMLENFNLSFDVNGNLDFFNDVVTCCRVLKDLLEFAADEGGIN